ncbi:MAG TPA: hypothetical protein VHS09_09420, partial [Polyangiaceae bacterium]|nr:hypothetical protein [Polyangiaceae bacterium]
MRPYPSARRWRLVLWLHGAAAAVAGCNGLLGTPEPEIAPEAGLEAGPTDAATRDVDATTLQ